MSSKKKNPNAVALGSRGGKARAESLSAAELSAIGKRGAKARSSKVSADRRSEIARKAVSARWAQAKKQEEK
jgi:hypothetical protein